MNQLNIQPLDRFVTGESASIRRPREIAFFSYDDAHIFHLDERSLRYYYPARIGADLSKGFETFQQLDDTADDHLDSLLRTLIDLEQGTGAKCQADVITWRGMMTKIMATPFDLFNGYVLHTLSSLRFPKARAISIDDLKLRDERNAISSGQVLPLMIAKTEWCSLTVYEKGYNPTAQSFMEENHAHKLASRNAQHQQTPNLGAASQDLMSYWGTSSWLNFLNFFFLHLRNPTAGYKFETLSLLPTPWAETSRGYIESREDLIVNNHAQYCSVVKTGIGKSKLILGGEVDALWDAKPTRTDDPINWVELKTAATPLSDRDILKYERKLLKFWIQSFLLGVPKIIVGFRSKDGILQSLEELETSQIPRLVKQKGKASWDGNLCINFTAAFLDWLKGTITEDGVWRIRKREKATVIEVFRLEESGHGDILSQEFVEWRSRQPELGHST
ncbi:MAG: hypothetical protein Q9182_003981 [Xanthomendoza sp. 2 TL-2023]